MESTVKTRIVIGSLLASLVLAPSALASTRHLEGSFEGDADAAVSMTIVVRHGEPRKAKDITVTNLDYRCDGTGETGGRSATFDDVPVFESARGGFEFEAEVSDGDAYFVIGGLMRRSVHRVTGGVAYYFDGPSGICESSAAGVGLYRAR